MIKYNRTTVIINEVTGCWWSTTRNSKINGVVNIKQNHIIVSENENKYRGD